MINDMIIYDLLRKSLTDDGLYIYIMHVGKISHSSNMVSHRHALSDGVCTNMHTIYEHIRKLLPYHLHSSSIET
jgi:hypothetical protein